MSGVTFVINPGTIIFNLTQPFSWNFVPLLSHEVYYKVEKKAAGKWVKWWTSITVILNASAVKGKCSTEQPQITSPQPHRL